MAYDLDEEILKNTAKALEHKEKLEIANQKQRKRKFQRDSDIKYTHHVKGELEADGDEDPKAAADKVTAKKKLQPRPKETPDAGNGREIENASVLVPSVVGMNYDKAAGALLAAGLDAFPYYIPGDSTEPIVVSSQPGAGSEVVSGQTITLVVSVKDQEEDEEEKEDKEKEDEEEDKDEEPEEARPEPQEGAEAPEAAAEGGGAGAGGAAAEGGAVAGGAAAGGTAAAAGSGGILAALAATWYIWLPILLIILLIVFLLVMVLIAPVAVCNMGGTAEALGIYAARKASQAAGYGDFCEGLIIKDNDPDVANKLNPLGNSDQEAQNRALLLKYGITVNKAAPDTQVGGMQITTLYEIISLAQACDAWARKPGDNGPPGNRCEIMVTGGNESGHSSGACSHATGFKVDLRITSLLDQYIRNTNVFKAAGRRSDGAFLYQYNSPGINVLYAREDDHWDVAVGC